MANFQWIRTLGRFNQKEQMLGRRQCEEHTLPVPRPSDTTIDAFCDWRQLAQYWMAGCRSGYSECITNGHESRCHRFDLITARILNYGRLAAWALTWYFGRMDYKRALLDRGWMAIMYEKHGQFWVWLRVENRLVEWQTTQTVNTWIFWIVKRLKHLLTGIKKVVDG